MASLAHAASGPLCTDLPLRFIHCSDLHLDSPLLGLERYPGAPVEALRGATREALANLIDLAVARAVDFVVIAGDVFDGDWKDMNTGLFFNAQMRRLERVGIPVYLKRGNHDAASEVTRALTLPDNVHVFPAHAAHTFRIDALRVALHGRSFADRAVPGDLAASYPDPVAGWFNIGVLHTSLGGYAVHDPYAPTSPDVLRGRGYDYWALGHVHAREVLQECAPRIVYCGNLQGRHVGEAGPKGCELVDVEGGEIRAESVPLDVVRWRSIVLTIDGFDEPSAFLGAARRVLGDAQDEAGSRLSAWRLLIAGSGPVHGWLAGRHDEAVAELRQIADAASAGRAWVETVRVGSRLPAERLARIAADDPVADGLRLVADLAGDPQALQAFVGPVLRELIGRLPPELRHGAQSVGLEDPQRLAALLQDAQALLLERLAEPSP